MTDDAIYCHNCGRKLKAASRFCDQCGEENLSWSEGPGEEQSPPGQPQKPQPAEPTPSKRIPDHFGHLFGDVYIDTRWYYGILEASGGLLILLSPRLFGRLFRDPLLWILQEDPEAFLWVAANYRTIGFVLIGISLGLRFKIDPDPVESDDSPDDAKSRGRREEKQSHSHSDPVAEDSDGGNGDEQPSFFTLYWLPGFSE